MVGAAGGAEVLPCARMRATCGADRTNAFRLPAMRGTIYYPVSRPARATRAVEPAS